MSFSGGIKKGGGFWNNVDAILTGYEFTTVKPGTKDEETEWIYFRPTAQVDGAKDETDQSLFFGGTEDYEISEDGLTVTSREGDTTSFGGNTPFGKFIASLIKPTQGGDGFPESDLPDLEGGEALNLEAILGSRVRFVQQVDEEGTKKRGKRKDKKTGKEYNRTDTVIGLYYGKGKAAKGGAKDAKAPAAGKKAKKGDDIAELSAEVLKAILKANGGELPKSKLSMKVLNFMLKHARKDAKEDVRKWLFEDDNLASVEGVSYDADSKTQVVSLD